MTRKALLELIRHRFKPGDNTNQYGLQFIEGVVDTVWEEFALQYLKINGDDAHYYSKVHTGVAVTLSGTTGYYTSTLPEEAVRDGVVRIYQATSRDFNFIPCSEKDMRYHKSLEVFDIGDKIYYYIGYDTIHYGENMTAGIASGGVYMDLIIPFSKYGLAEELPMPNGVQSSFIDMVLNRLNGVPIYDQANQND